MRIQRFGSWLIATLYGSLLLVSMACFADASPVNELVKHIQIPIQLDQKAEHNFSGRLLLFIKAGSDADEVDTNPFSIGQTWIAAKEVSNIAPGATVMLDADDIAFPKGFSQLPSGKYQAQAVLDVDRSYNYSGRSPHAWISDVVKVDWVLGSVTSITLPVIKLDHHPEENPKRIEQRDINLSKVKPDAVHEEHFISPQLSKFWGRATEVKAWVILPPNYQDKAIKSFPTVYWTHGFGGNLEYSLDTGLKIRARMEKGEIPPMIWVMLDESIPQGTHEFADSINNGPWGAALTTEFIPYLEQHYRMDAKANGRFLNGHSSGGWATLQLQINYPTVFGGTWSTSPDSSDFHDFTGPDLYAPNANAYQRADGSDYPLVRAGGKIIATLRQFAQMEDVLGPYGGQMTSFEWVFSPKDDSGAPMSLFNRQTGVVNPKVVEYWRDHYDLAHIVTTHWADRGADLTGRIHLYVGTADTFYLDGAAHRLQAVLDGLKADAHFTFLPDRSHFNVYELNGDKNGLMVQIAKEMYAIARPVAKNK
jgi:S-formylglutathione hydrolase FrmB